MGVGASEDHRHASYQKKQNGGQSQTRSSKFKTFILIVLTNLFTIYILTGPYSFDLEVPSTRLQSFTNWNSTSSTLAAELHSTKQQLATSHSVITDLLHRLNSTNLLLQSLLIELSTRRSTNSEDDNDVHQSITTARQLIMNLPREVQLAMGPHKLPLGFHPRTGSDEIHPPVGAGCLNYPKELEQFLTYEVGGECPLDDVFAQRMMLRGCEPLPRRRCHPPSPRNYVHPTPFPESLWTTPADTSIVWEPYTCKSYKCLVDRKKFPGFFDCKDCFDLEGREKVRWMVDRGGLDFGMDQVLATRPRGTIRIGMDIGGGSGTFAARMRERNITIITSTMNLDGPFNSFIASRGLISIHFSVSQRLPFFENTMDIVHSMHVLSNWIPDVMLEFTLYDIYRVLRPGGLFWLDHFFCFGSQLNGTYIPMLDRVGFKKLRWHAGKKLDKGADKNEWYFSALLEKPMS
ncbi:unnamed protein product [Linum trigynum]|uniref:Methyltransferase type 11 domain-containing protein n=1 Tax=Linum trigynum TaxID=586398 RepID=A0AAV2C9E2_9ROSI